MLKHYSHIRMEAKRTALESIVAKKADPNPVAGSAVPTKVPTLEERSAFGAECGHNNEHSTVDPANCLFVRSGWGFRGNVNAIPG